MEYIYTFVGGSPDFKWLSKREFRLQFGLAEALGYLEQIRGTLISEARDHRHPGCFYTGLRHAFAEIDGLGKLYKGASVLLARANFGCGSSREHAPWGVKDYGFRVVFDMYRHGLAHSHLIRTARYLKGGKWHFVYWEITEERKDHLALRRNGTRTWLVVSVPQLVDDMIAAIERFIQDLKAGGANSRLLSKFKKGYEGTCTTLREPPPPVVKKTGAAKTKSKPKKLKLNSYSWDGIDWIRRNT